MKLHTALRSCALGALAATALLGPGTAARADDGGATGVLHFVHTETGVYPGPGDDPHSFYGIFGLDGACGFTSARFAQSDTENFYVTEHQNGAAAGDWQARAVIADEPWQLVVDDGTATTTFAGTADEFVTARGAGSPGDFTSINYRFDGTAADGAGRVLHLIVQGRLRTDRAGDVTRFDYAVQSCTVH